MNEQIKPRENTLVSLKLSLQENMKRGSYWSWKEFINVRLLWLRNFEHFRLLNTATPGVFFIRLNNTIASDDMSIAWIHFSFMSFWSRKCLHADSSIWRQLFNLRSFDVCLNCTLLGLLYTFPLRKRSFHAVLCGLVAGDALHCWMWLKTNPDPSAAERVNTID